MSHVPPSDRISIIELTGGEPTLLGLWKSYLYSRSMAALYVVGLEIVVADECSGWYGGAKKTIYKISGRNWIWFRSRDHFIHCQMHSYCVVQPIICSACSSNSGSKRERSTRDLE